MSDTKEIPARFRDRDDAAYRQAHRDDVIQHQIDLGHTPAWIAVLTGSAPAIILPVGDVNAEELERCRQAVLDMHEFAAPEEPYYDEFDQYLTPRQLERLRKGYPVIMMAYFERQFDLDKHREHSLLQNRVRDSIEFGLAQALQFIGRLFVSRTAAPVIYAKVSTEQAIELLKGWIRQHDDEDQQTQWGEYILHLKKVGGLHPRAAHFVDPTSADDLIRADIKAARATVNGRNLERRFWYTVVNSLLATRGHDGKQASAHRKMSNALKLMKKIVRGHWLDFYGVTRPSVSLVDILALAYFEMPDAYRLFPAFHFHFPDMEAAAALGALSRDRLVRVDEKTTARLLRILSFPETKGLESSAELAPEPMTANEFLRHAMDRVGTEEWWKQVLENSPDNFGIRHFRKGHCSQPTQSTDIPRTAAGVCSHPVAKKLLSFAEQRFDLRIGQNALGRIWHYPLVGKLAVLDLERMADYCQDDDNLLIANLVEFTAAGTDDMLGLKGLQTNSPQKVGYYREMVRVAVASETVMSKFETRIPEFRALDLRYYARFLTDREYESCRQAGEATGQLILDFISRELADVEANHNPNVKLNSEDRNSETKRVESRKKSTRNKKRRKR